MARRECRNFTPYRERAGECDRCEKWQKMIGDDGLCVGCRETERRAEPVRVPSDDRRTPGLRVGPVPQHPVYGGDAFCLAQGQRRMRELGLKP